MTSEGEAIRPEEEGIRKLVTSEKTRLRKVTNIIFQHDRVQ